MQKTLYNQMKKSYQEDMDIDIDKLLKEYGIYIDEN